MLLLASLAAALDLDSARLSGAPWEAEGAFGLVGAHVAPVRSYSFGVAGIYAHEVSHHHIDALGTVRAAGGFVPVRNLRLDAEVPLHLRMAEEGASVHLGDIELRGRTTLAHGHLGALHSGPGPQWTLGLAPSLGVPTGDVEAGLGSGGVSAGLVVPGSFLLGPAWRIEGNVGVTAARAGVAAGVELGSYASWGFGGAWAGWRDLHIGAELTGRVDLVGAIGEGDTPLDVGASVGWAGPTGFGVMLGGSVGILHGPGVPAARAALAVGYSGRRPAPPLDTDLDGLADDSDPCPFAAEDIDGLFDADGCPDLDDDRDGLADTLDECPLLPEDVDGLHDADGCPDDDDDGDQVADALDQCLSVRGLPKFAGCIDGDRDGLSDIADACPSKPGGKTGCPEALSAR